MHDTCVWLVQVIFYDRHVLHASQQNILHLHIMSLLGVPTLSTFCSTPPRCVNVDLGINPINVVSSLLPSFVLYFFCDVFSEKHTFTLLFEQIGEHNISLLLHPKKHSVCALCCWGLCFGFAICCWFFQKQNKLLYSILQQKLIFMFLVVFL